MKAIRQIAQMGWGFSHRALRRRRWDDSARWFRLRYPEAGRVQNALNLLSRHTDRLGLRLRVEGGVSQLFIGVSTDAVSHVLESMAQDMNFRLTATDRIPPPLNGQFRLAQLLVEKNSQLEAVDAYLVREQLFTLSEAKPSEKGWRFPESASLNGHEPGSWKILEPVLGTTTRPEWIEPTPPELALGNEGEWALGRTPDGLVMGGRQVQVLGDDDSVAEWLTRLVLTRAGNKSAGLVVIDGRGDLVPRLLATPSIAHLRSAKQITNLDINVAGQGGVNPLAIGSDEDPTSVVERWRWWFSGMGVVGRSLDLLPRAIDAGISDLPALHRWLKKQSADSFAAAANLRSTLDQLMRNQVVNRWLTLYPVALQEALENRALIIACPHKGSWSRLQAIRAVMGLVTEPETDFVLHHVPLAEGDMGRLKELRIVIGTNTPNAIPSIRTTVLTKLGDHSAGKAVAALRSALNRDLLDQDGVSAGHTQAMVAEHIQCLQCGEAIVARDGYVGWCSFEIGMKKASVNTNKS